MSPWNPRIREDVETLMRACQALAGLVHYHKLTEKERLAVVSSVRALELEVEPSIPLLSTDNPPVAMTLSNTSPID